MNAKTIPAEAEASLLYSVTNLSQTSDKRILNKGNIW